MTEKTFTGTHGTHGGLNQHRRKGIPVCDECRAFESAYRAANYQKNKERKIALAKTYYKNNKAAHQERGRIWRAANLEKARESARKYYQKNPGAPRRKRRARIAGNGFEPYTLEQVLQEYGAVCYLCEEAIDLTLPRKAGVPGWGWGLHIDHVIPIAKGGTDSLDNVAPVHGICNLNKGIS